MKARSVGLIAAVCGLASGVSGLSAVPAAAAPVSVGHSGWAWGDPTPQGQQLSAVAFSGATGFAVGDFGTVVRSVDGGATWTGLPSGTINDLSVVQEISPGVVIVGGGCTVRESVNGGASFTSMPINPTETSCPTNVASFSFSDQSTGYVELADGSVFFTADGGQTVQAKTSAPINNGIATDLEFLSPTTGFAVSGASVGNDGSGGVIERTTDSANSWTQVGSAPHGLNAITFVTPTQGFAVGDDDTLLASSDGGATWRAQPLALPAGAGPFNLARISCSSATTCVITTRDGKELVRTADGGATGSIVSPSSQLLSDVAFSTGSNVVGVGAHGATVLSADGGQTFPNVISGNLGFVLDATGAGIVGGGTPGSAYVPGTSGHIAATNDSGATWSLLRAPTTSAVSAIAFPTTSKGFELESDGTLRTTSNGGVAWASLDTGVTNASALAATSAQDVLLVGPRGIYRSTGAGAGFSPVAGRVVIATKPKRTTSVSKLALARTQTVGGTVLAWGASGLFESTNGGASWKLIPRPLPKGHLISVSFVSASTGYVMDNSKRVFFTRSSGRKWTRVTTIPYPDLGSLSFSSASTGIIALSVYNWDSAAFDAVDVIATTNGGKSWQPEVIDGEQAGLILATPGVDYYDEAGQSNSNYSVQSGLLATTNGGLSPTPSTLAFSIGPKKLSAKALRKAGNKVTIRGTLSPVTSVGEQVLVSYQTPGALTWRTQLVTVASSGAFTTVIHAIKATTEFFAAAVGNGLDGGAGTTAVILKVR
jgi:photosystem II stability/assembly factor-like uncharacterized protein